MKNNIYDIMKVSNERHGIGHTKNKAYSNITINSGVCHRGSEVCERNATKICFKCSIMTGDVRLQILFVPAITRMTTDALDQVVKETIKQPEFNSIELIHPPLPTEEPKVAPTDEDEFDKLTKVKFIEEAQITHSHSGHIKIHTHYYNIGNIMQGSECHVCNYSPIYGRHLCPQCEQIYFEE